MAALPNEHRCCRILEGNRGLPVALLLSALLTATLTLAEDKVFHLLGSSSPDPINLAATGRTGTAVRFGQPVTLDGRLEEALWQTAPAIESFVVFGSAAPAAIATSAHLGYDATTLYIGVSCDEPRIEDLRGQAGLPRDADQVWQDDCIELFLDPAGTGKSFFHLIASAGGGRYDERFPGLSGSLEAGDSSWNGEWEVATARSAGRWTAELRVPLRTLEAEPPAPGRVWGIQLMRSRQPHPAGTFTWTPVPDNVLASPAHFGRLLFDGFTMKLLDLTLDPPGLGRNRLSFALANETDTPVEATVALSLAPSGGNAREFLREIELPARQQTRAELLYTLERLEAGYAANFQVRDRQTGQVLFDRPFDPAVPSGAARFSFDGLFFKAEARVGLAALQESTWEARLSVLDGKGKALITERSVLRTTRLSGKVRLGKYARKATQVRFEAGPPGKPAWASASADYFASSEPYEVSARHDVIPVLSRPKRLGKVPIRIQPPPAALSLASFPVQCGMPFPRGELRAVEHLQLLDPDGEGVPFQTRTLAWWDPPGTKDASIQWLLVAFQARLQSGAEYTLRYGSRVEKPPATASTLHAFATKSGVRLDTGVLRAEFGMRSPALLDQAWLDTDRDGRYSEGEKLLKESEAKGLYLLDQDGTLYRSALDSAGSLDIEESGPQQVTVKATGFYVNARGEKLNRWMLRVKAYAGQPFLRLYHTFIITEDSARKQYRDIGIELPLAAAALRNVSFARGTAYQVSNALPEPVERNPILFRSDAWKTFDSLFLLQDSHRHYSVWSDAAELLSNERFGHWMDATGDAAGMAVAMRWSWQNFPCGLEALRDGRVRVHLWSQRGRVNLDFRPRPYLESRGRWEVWSQQIMDVRDRRHEYPPELGGSMVADGIGVAKTHELLLLFHNAQETETVPEIAYLLQKPVLAFAAPEWLRQTEALGRLHPHDPTRFRDAERVMSLYMDQFLKDQSDDVSIGDPRYGDSFGAFDFGDTLHQGKYAHRYWSHRFYVTPSMFWMQFARTGDRRYFEFGEANARHLMDIDTCHHADGDRLRPGYLNNDDAGVVHWAGFSPSYVCTNDYVNYLLTYYYLTGYERARDVAVEVESMVLEAAKKGYPHWSHRATGFTLWAAVVLYRFTWNEELKKLADHLARQVVENVRDGVSTGYSGSDAADFTLAYIFPGIIAYHQLTGDPAAAEWIINQASYMTRWKIIDGQGGSFNQWDGLAYAYHLTGDRKFLELPRPFLESLACQTEKDVPLFIGSRVWWIFKAGYLLDALADAGLASAAETPAPDSASPAPAMRPDPRPESTAGEILLLDSDDRAFQIDLRLVRLATDDARVHPLLGSLETEVTAGGPAVVLYGPDGRERDRRPYPAAPAIDGWYHRGGWVEHFTVPKDGQAGIHRLRMETRQGVLFQMILITNTLGKAMFSGGSGDGLSPGFRYPPVKPYFFYVPPATERFQFDFHLLPYWHDFTLKVLDPEGRAVVDRNLGTESDRPKQGWLAVAVLCPPETRGKFWSAVIGSYGEVRIFKLNGVPAYFGESLESAFVPEMARPSER